MLYDIDGNDRPIDGVNEQRGDSSDYDIGADEFIGVSPYNNSPNKPVNLLPGDYAIDQSYKPTLICSDFSDSDLNDYHIASRWQIDAPVILSLLYLIVMLISIIKLKLLLNREYWL